MKVLRGLIKQAKFNWAAELRNVPKVVAVELLESIFFEGRKKIGLKYFRGKKVALSNDETFDGKPFCPILNFFHIGSGKL